MTDDIPPPRDAPSYVQGDVANGHMLGSDGVWRPVVIASAAPATPMPSRKPWFKSPLGIAGLIVAAVVVLAVIGAVGGSDPDTGSGSGSGSIVGRSTRQVVYEVEGTTNQASITISTPGGGTSQQSDIDVPMMSKDGGRGLRITYPAGAFVYISAQNSNDTGSLTCRITVDGVVIAENTSSGAYVIASCEGQAQ